MMHQFTKRPKIAAIIPAFNEEATIASVVSIVKNSSWVDEVIVICDGSTDETALRAEEEGATVYRLIYNQGKGEALREGVSKTNAPILLFFDADLRGLTQEHIGQLVLPVLYGSREMNVGLRDRGFFWTKITKHLPLIGGERALRRSIFTFIPPEYLQKFMVESALNYSCRCRHLPYGSVILRGLSIRRKYEKVGIFLAFKQYISMFFQVIKGMMVIRMARWVGIFKT